MDKLVFLSKEEVIENLRNTLPMKGISSEYMSQVTGLSLYEIRRIRLANTRRIYNQDPEHIEIRRERQRVAYAAKKAVKDKATVEAGGVPRKGGKIDIFGGKFPVKEQ